MSKFEQYQTFVTIVELGSLAKAANVLNLSPSAVSKQLTGLEEQLDVQLVDRSTRSLSVTHSGKKFYSECKAIIRQIAQAEDRLKEDEGTLVGKICLSCPRVIPQSGFVSLMKSFTSNFEGIKIDLSISDDIEDLIGGNIDFAFRTGKLQNSNLHAVPLLETRPVLLTSKEYIDRYGRPTTLFELRQHRLIVPTYLNLSEKMKALFPLEGALDLQEHTTTNDAQVLLEMIKQGFGIAVMLDLIAKQSLESREVINLFPNMQLPKTTVYLLYHKQIRLPERLVVFKDYIKEHITEFF